MKTLSSNDVNITESQLILALSYYMENDLDNAIDLVESVEHRLSSIAQELRLEKANAQKQLTLIK